MNFVRILSLYYVALYASISFDFIHLEIWPALMMLTTVALFLRLIVYGTGTHTRPAR